MSVCEGWYGLRSVEDGSWDWTGGGKGWEKDQRKLMFVSGNGSGSGSGSGSGNSPMADNQS